jgi:hypothetical protein
MTSFFHTENRSFFACFSVPNSSPLRRTVLQSSRRDITIRVTQTTSVTGGTASPCNFPLVVTTSGPQATMSNRQNSVTSLNSQGRVVNV